MFQNQLFQQFEGIDNYTNSKIWMHLYQTLEMRDKEKEILDHFRFSECFPELIKSGSFPTKPGVITYANGPSLKEMVEEYKSFSVKTTLQIGIQLIDIV